MFYVYVFCTLCTEFLNSSFLLSSFTCVMEPPGLLEEMRGGGSGIVRGLTAASRLPSCGRVGSEGWPACWNAGEEET